MSLTYLQKVIEIILIVWKKLQLKTQKCSNRFENNAEKWHLLIILTITFDSQSIFEWGLFHWKSDILDFNLNTNFA